jgi:hypothetical protein
MVISERARARIATKIPGREFRWDDPRFLVAGGIIDERVV